MGSLQVPLSPWRQDAVGWTVPSWAQARQDLGPTLQASAPPRPPPPAEQPLPPPVQVPEEHFPALLAYLEGLKGRARELTVQKAEALMRELDQAGADHPDPPLRAKTRRVRQVLQLLS